MTAIRALSVLLQLITGVKELLSRFNIFKRDRRIKKDYKDAKRNVRRGNIDQINDILKSLIPFIIFGWLL